VTPPRAPESTPGAAESTAGARSQALLLLLPALVPLVVAALTPTASLFPDQGDLNLYLEKAGAFASGGVPYRDFPFEYPPLGLIPMVVPDLVGRLFGDVTLDAYKWLFAGWEAILVAALGVLLARIVRLGGAPAVGDTARLALRLVVLTIGAAFALTWRFDLFPAVLATGAVWLALEDRPGAAGVAIAGGILAKLYPVALVPALAARWLVPLDGARLIRFGLSIAVMLVAVMLPFAFFAGRDAFAFAGYLFARPLQIESIGGGLVVLAGLVADRPADMSFDFSAVNVQGPLARSILGVLPLLTVALFGLLAWLGWRRLRGAVARDGVVPPSLIVTLATASLLALLVTSKVYSIQYVVWLVPFAALLPIRQFWLAAALVALTIPIHPLLYADLVKQEALAILVLNVRNALVVVLFVLLLRELARVGSIIPRPTPSRSSMPGPASPD